MNIVCFPENWYLIILGQIMLGGGEKVKEAGGVLAGGHSIADTDVKYGLSVMGTIHPDKVFANNGCRAGDVLILTKPLGVGIVCTANRIQEASEEAMAQAIRSMTTLNKYASEVVRKYQVHGCTDVTGFGFLGHLLETSGGLLVSIEKSDAEQCLEELKALGLPCAIVGEVTEKREKKIEVR